MADGDLWQLVSNGLHWADKCAELYFRHIDKVIWIVAIAAYALHLFLNRACADRIAIALSKAVTSGGIPNGVAFLICALIPDYVVHMKGAFLAFLVGGLALISITFMDLYKASGNTNPT